MFSFHMSWPPHVLMNYIASGELVNQAHMCLCLKNIWVSFMYFNASINKSNKLFF